MVCPEGPAGAATGAADDSEDDEGGDDSEEERGDDEHDDEAYRILSGSPRRRLDSFGRVDAGGSRGNGGPPGWMGSCFTGSTAGDFGDMVCPEGPAGVATGRCCETSVGDDDDGETWAVTVPES